MYLFVPELLFKKPKLSTIHPSIQIFHSSLMTIMQHALERLQRDSWEFYLDPQVPIIQPSSYNDSSFPLTCQREFIAKNKPFLMKGFCQSWPAFECWQDDTYLTQIVGDQRVTVSVTPTGYADGIHDNRFALPMESHLLFKDFLALLCDERRKPIKDAVYYIQTQNSNLTDEFALLLSDVPSHIDLFSQCLDKLPDAVNFWMGEQRAVTSLHKDPYENVYCVIKGKKTFILYPPTARPHLPHKHYPVAQFHYDHSNHTWSLEDSHIDPIPWINYDPLTGSFPAPVFPPNFVRHYSESNESLHSDEEKRKKCNRDEDSQEIPSVCCNEKLLMPSSLEQDQRFQLIDRDQLASHSKVEVCTSDFKDCIHCSRSCAGTCSCEPGDGISLRSQPRGYTVHVEAGDALYLPSLWFHHVQQSHGCIAVNYWYDMEFDVKYNYYQLVESLSTL